MLQTLRDKTSGWFATVILGLLIVPFAFVGITDYVQRSNSQAVATIAVPPSWWESAPAWMPFVWTKAEVTQDEYRSELENRRRQARQEQGEAFDLRAFDAVDNKRQILERLVDQRVQKLWAETHGVVASDTMVRKEIASIPAFQANGRFDIQQYRRVLATGLDRPQSEAQFEETIRDSLVQSAVPTAIAGSSFVTGREFERLVAIIGERRDFTLLELPAPAIDTAPVGPAEMERWYRERRDRYRAPEAVTVEYVDVNGAALPMPVVDDAVLRQQYEKDRARYTAEERRLASHILIRVDAAGGAAAATAARDKAQRIAAQARAPGADFAALARANSDDTGSKANGGDLGWVGRGVMAAEFEKALFAMQAGQVSAPVKTDFGWHVIQLREVQAGRQQAFEQVRESLAADYVKTEREKRFNALTSKIVDASLDDPNALAAAARAAGLQAQRVGPIARGQGAGVLAHPAVQRAAFAESAIQDGMVSDALEVGDDHVVLLRVVAHRPARQLTLSEARDRVVADVRADRMRKAAERRAAAVLAQVRGGQPLAQVAAAQGLAAPRPLVGLPRGTDVFGEGSSDMLFGVVPQKGRVAASSHVLPDARAIVFTVDRVQPGTTAELPPGQGEAIRRQIAELNGMTDVEAMTKALRRRMRIEVQESML
ncbi:SurA N-terminal domain-containing protein [Lysobacter humi (ex Lee et al. 2017)]